MLFHRSKPAVTVFNADEERALGSEWSRIIPQPEPAPVPSPQSSRWEPEPEDEPEQEPEQPEDGPEEQPEEEEQPAGEDAPAKPKRARPTLKRFIDRRRKK